MPTERNTAGTPGAGQVEFYRHSLDEADVRAVAQVLRSPFLTTGQVNRDFEARFAELTGLAEIVSVSSCTAALHLALAALGVGPGDEVITTPLTYVATVTAIMQAGATPVLADVEPATGLLDVAQVEKALTARTKAILPVHLYGTLAPMRALRELADRRGLYIVEDAAHCIEGEREGVRPGHLGDAACYSFYATKNLTCGEGGAIGVRDPERAAQLRRMRLHGVAKDAFARHADQYQHWDMSEFGWKYNLDDIHAALLVNQMQKLEQRWRRRRDIWRRYDEAFGGAGIERPLVVGESACHLYTLWVAPERRDRLLLDLQQRGIGVTVNYRAVHHLAYIKERFGHQPQDFPHAHRIGQRTLSLPLYPALGDEGVERVIDAVLSLGGGPAAQPD